MKQHRYLVHGLCLMALCLLPASAIGQTPKKDYSRGFAKFHRMGLPDVSKAEYVHLNLYNHSGGSFHHGGLYGIRLSGNAWMLSENKKGKSIFIMNNRRVEVYDNKTVMKERQKKMAEEQKKQKAEGQKVIVSHFDMSNDGKTTGQWKKVDLKKDVEKTLRFIEKKLAKPTRYDPFSYSDAYGSLFLSAIQYHSQGYTNEASQMVGMLFRASKDKRKVIMQGLGHLADSQYEDCIEAFFKTQDWAALDTDLTALLKKFAVGWKRGLAVKRLTVNVKKHLQKTGESKLISDTLSLTDEDQALAAKLMTAEDYMMHRSHYYGSSRRQYGQIWVLVDPADTEKVDDVPEAVSAISPEKKDPHVLDVIKERGMKSIPLLLALLKDDAFVRMDYKKHSHSYSSHRYGPQEMTEEQITQMYNALHRPVTRSEIAMDLLKYLPIREQSRRYRHSNQDPDDLYEDVKAWYDENKDKSSIELARLYMKQGDSSQKNSGSQYVMQNGTEADMKDIEANLLDAFSREDGMYHSGYGSVRQYVEMRGEKAKDFVEKYEARMKEAMASTDNKMFKDDNFKKHMERELKEVKKILSTKPAREVLAELLEGKATWRESQGQLYRQLAREKKNAAISMILDAAVKVKDPQVASQLISYTSSIRHLGRYNRYGGMPQKEKKDDKLDMKLHVAAWKQLLADKRPINQMYSQGRKQTVGDTAAWALETVYQEQPHLNRSSIPYTLGEKLSPIVHKRAAARLAGKTGDDLPAFPSADNLTAEQKKALTAKITSASTAELTGLIAGLSLDEQLALLQDFPEEKAFNLKAAPVAYTVSRVKGKTLTPDTMETCRAFKGKRLDKKMVEALLELTKKITKADHIFQCNIVRQSGLRGVQIVLTEIDPASSEYKKMYAAQGGRLYPNPRAMVSAYVSGGGLSGGNASWTVKTSEKKKKVPAPNARPPMANDELFADALTEMHEEENEYQKEEQERFWEGVKEFLAGEDNLGQQANIHLSGQPIIEVEKEGESS